jgi:hypothetical protein
VRYLHKALLHIAGQHSVLANVHYHLVGRHFFFRLHLYVGSVASESTSGGDFWSMKIFLKKM